MIHSSSSIANFTFAEFELCLHFKIAQKTNKISLLDRKSTVERKER